MEKEILTRCGMRCDLCVAYVHHPDQKNPEERKRASDVWEKYFGFRLEPEAIVCGGCLEEETGLLDKECPVRPCVIQNGYETCAACDRFTGCETLDKRLVDEAHTVENTGGVIPDIDRKYIEAFMNHKRLADIRKKTGG